MRLREVPDLPRSLARDLATAAAFREAAQHRRLVLSGNAVDAPTVRHARKGLAYMPATAAKAQKYTTVDAVTYKPTYLERKFWNLDTQPG